MTQKQELAPDFRIFALDLLGFGHAEKPPVTYTQYLWQDQASHFGVVFVLNLFVLAKPLPPLPIQATHEILLPFNPHHHHHTTHTHTHNSNPPPFPSL
jgi:hypothetical protein